MTAQPTTKKYRPISVRDFAIALIPGIAAALLFWLLVSRLVPWCPTGQEPWCLGPVTDRELPHWFVQSRLTFFYSFVSLPTGLSIAAALSFIRAFYFADGMTWHGYIHLIAGASAGVWLTVVFSVLVPIFSSLTPYLFFMAVLLVLNIVVFIIATREYPHYGSLAVRLFFLNLVVAGIFWGPFLLFLSEIVSD